MNRSLPLALAGAVALAATNSDFRVWSGYEVRINVCHELDLLGRHFFPEWAGRELRFVPCTSEAAHRADYGEAAAAAGMPPERAASRLEELLGFADAAKARIEAGEEASLPSGLEDFEREFFLYALGRAQRLADETLAEPPAWLELLLSFFELEDSAETLLELKGKDYMDNQFSMHSDFYNENILYGNP